MNYYYPYGPMPTPISSGYRFQQNPHLEPPYPSGSMITSSTPTGPSQTTGGSQFNHFNPHNPLGKSDAAAALTMNYGTGGSSYIDTILRLNRGKLANVHMTFNSGGATSESRTFTGIIETAGRDHIILSDPNTDYRYVLLMVYLDFIEFPEEINYYYPRSNVLSIVDETVLQENPEILPLFYYTKAQKEMLIRQLESSIPAAPEEQ